MDNNNGQQTIKALVLPKAAQDQLAAGITRGIEGMTGLLDMIKTAQVTDEGGTQVPPDFVEQGKQVAMLVASLFDQFAAAPTAPASEPDPAMAGLAPEELALAKSASGAVVKAALATMKNIEAVTKGKVKMSFDQAMKLHGGLMEKLYSIANEIAPLVAEFGADGITAALGGGDTAKTQKNAPAQDGAKPNDGSTTTTPETALDAVTKAITGLRADVDRIGKSRGPSNAVPANEGNGEAPVHVPAYGQDYGSIIKARQQAAAQKNGAA